MVIGGLMISQNKKSLHNFVYFLTYGICFIAIGLAGSALGPTLPSLAEHANVSLAQISFLFTATSFGYMIGSVGGGRLFDHLNGHRLMLIALLLMSLSFFLIPLTSTFNLLIAILFLLGLGQGVVDVGGNVNLLWVYKGAVGPYMNALHFCFGVGAFLSPIILHNLTNLGGGLIKWAFWVLAILTLPGMFGLGLLPSPENPEKEAIKNEPGTTNILLVALMVALLFLYVGVEMGFGGWIFTYATETNIANEAGAALMTSIFWGALTLGRFLSIPLAKKLALTKILLGNFILAIFFLIIILVFPIQPGVIWISSAGLGLALSSVFPTVLSLGESRMKITGKITGLFFIGTSLGGSLIPMMLGQIFEYVGSYQIMIALLVTTVIGFVVLMTVIHTSNIVGEKRRN